MNILLPNLVPALIILISFYIAATVFFAYGARRANQARQAFGSRQEATLHVVREAVDNLPSVDAVPPKAETPKQQVTYLVVICILFSLVYLALYFLIGIIVRLLWPNLAGADVDVVMRLLWQNSTAIELDIVVSMALPMILGWLLLPLLERRIILSSPSRKLTDWDKLLLTNLRFTHWMAVFSAAIGTPLVILATHNWLSSFWAVFVAYFVFVVLIRFFGKSTLYFPQYWVQSALARADYKEALRRVQHLETKYSQSFNTLYSRGTVLLFAGQYTEAEQYLRHSLQEALKFNQCLPEIMTNLGYALLRQERYVEASRVLQGAIKLNPKSGHALSGLVEIFLYQGIEPQQALDLITQFLKIISPRQVTDKTIWGAVVGDEAWALAMLGRHADAQDVIKEAFQLTDKSFKPGLAGLYYRAGKVSQIKGERSQAIHSFERAMQLDPDGAFGQQAQQALNGLRLDGDE